MALLNVDAALPPHMWAVVRLLAMDKKSTPVEDVRQLLSPPSLVAGGKQDKTFDQAVRTLRDLGILSGTRADDELALGDSARHLDGNDLAAFTAVLRAAVLAPERNTGLADSDDTIGPRDLTRTLVMFLSEDPLGTPLTWQDAQIAQSSAFKSDGGDPARNNTRWNNFAHWAPALGLGAKPLFPIGGQAPLTPDCTGAVKQTVGYCWKVDERVNAVDLVRGVRAELPVLPGGRYADSLGMSSPGESCADAVLSHALLRGEHEGWLRLERHADARRAISVVDPDQPTRRVTDIVILEQLRG